MMAKNAMTKTVQWGRFTLVDFLDLSGKAVLQAP